MAAYHSHQCPRSQFNPVLSLKRHRLDIEYTASMVVQNYSQIKKPNVPKPQCIRKERHQHLLSTQEDHVPNKQVAREGGLIKDWGR